MSNDKTSQTQKAFGFVTNLVDQQFDRMNAWMEQMEKMQSKGLDRTEDAIDEMANLSKETLHYADKLSSEWRKMSIDAMRQTTDAVRSDDA